MSLARLYRISAVTALIAVVVGAAHAQVTTAPPAPILEDSEAGGYAATSLPAGVDLTAPLTLADCARVALALNPSLAAAEQQVVQAGAAVVQARSTLMPSLSLGGSLSASESLRGEGLAGVNSRSTNRDLSLQLSQVFYQSGLSRQIAGARASALAAQWGFSDSRRTLLLEVAQSYYDALAALALAEVAHRAVRASTLHLDAANARIEAGTAARSDRFPFEVELQQALVQAIAAENQITLSFNALRRAMGLPATTPLRLADALGQPPVPGGLEGLRAQALAQRPDVAQRQAQVEAARHSARLADIRRGPVVTASGSDNYGLHTDADGNAWQVGVSVSLPIFDGRATKAAAESAYAGLAIAEEALRQAQLTALTDVENSYATAQQANRQIDVAEAAVTAAEVAAQAAQERYQAGVGTVIEVTDAELRLRQAEADRVQALYSYNTALAALRASAGGAAVEGLEP